MGRAPCCDKARVKRGPWSPEEDEQLRSHVRTHGIGNNWIDLPHKAGLNRCGKSCRLRWLNYLRPDIRHGGYTDQEDHVICSLYASIGSRWSIIASKLPGRTDNDVKNYWNTRLKKKYLCGDASLGAFSAPGTARSWSQSTSSLQPAALSSAASAFSSVDTSSSGVTCFAAAAMYHPPRPPQPMQGLVHFDSPPQTVLAPVPPAAAAGSWASSASDSGMALEDTVLTDLDAYGDLLFGGFGGLMQDDEAATMELSAACYFPNMSDSADHAHVKPPPGLCNTFTWDS